MSRFPYFAPEKIQFQKAAPANPANPANSLPDISTISSFSGGILADLVSSEIYEECVAIMALDSELSQQDAQAADFEDCMALYEGEQ